MLRSSVVVFLFSSNVAAQSCPGTKVEAGVKTVGELAANECGNLKEFDCCVRCFYQRTDCVAVDNVDGCCYYYSSIQNTRSDASSSRITNDQVAPTTTALRGRRRRSSSVPSTTTTTRRRRRRRSSPAPSTTTTTQRRRRRRSSPATPRRRRRRSSPTPPTPTGHQVARWMNTMYKGFVPQNHSSPLGVTISMQNEWAIYCSEIGASCYQGHADCRFSASLYNHKMMLDRKSNGIKITMSRVAGIVFNQTLVQNTIGKCSYMFDGASFNRYNGACGCVARSVDCHNPSSAFGNVCPSTGKVCIVEDKEVAKCSCEVMHEPNRSDVPQCYWKGAGIDRDHVQADVDQTRQMVQARLRHQDGSDSNDRLEYWNEVVIDEHLLLEQFRVDPVPVIPAFVYVKGNPAGIAYARKMRNDYVQQYSVSAEIPLIAIDPHVDVNESDGPFLYEQDLAVEGMLI